MQTGGYFTVKQFLRCSKRSVGTASQPYYPLQVIKLSIALITIPTKATMCPYFPFECQQVVVSVAVKILTIREPEFISSVVLLVLLGEVAVAVVHEERCVGYTAVVVRRESG